VCNGSIEIGEIGLQSGKERNNLDRPRAIEMSVLVCHLRRISCILSTGWIVVLRAMLIIIQYSVNLITIIIAISVIKRHFKII
jgi:hypothetical protein